MFGVLTPALQYVSVEYKQQYNTIYCNLCAALSASGAGVLNRFFLVNDVVTVDWLLTENMAKKDHAFSCRNCVKGGVVGKKRNVSEHQRLLAALSTFSCGIKLQDNANDAPSFKHKIATWLYRPMMKKAEAVLQNYAVLDQLKSYMLINHVNEVNATQSLEKACEPTEKCYELVTVAIGESNSNLPTSMLQLIGRYLGRCVYILDAIKDMNADKKNQQYNVLNSMSSNEQSMKTPVLQQCLEFLRPMRLEISQQAIELSKSLRDKSDSLFLSIENQLAVLLRPFGDERLIHTITSFSALSGCSSGSLWSKINIGDLPTDRCCRGCCC